jgi:ribosomal protein L27
VGLYARHYCVFDLLTPPVSDQAVIPGNIIVRQRGTVFHPGQHVRSYFQFTPFPSNGLLQVKMGRDHTIYAVAPGFVRFYREKYMRGERKYVGVVLSRGEILPRNESELGRSRYFGFVNLRSLQGQGKRYDANKPPSVSEAAPVVSSTIDSSA